jgi:hypothetical protein
MISTMKELDAHFRSLLTSIQAGDWAKAVEIWTQISNGDLPHDRMQPIPEFESMEVIDFRLARLRDNIRNLKDAIVSKDEAESERLISECLEFIAALERKSKTL